MMPSVAIEQDAHQKHEREISPAPVESHDSAQTRQRAAPPSPETPMAVVNPSQSSWARRELLLRSTAAIADAVGDQ